MKRRLVFRGPVELERVWRELAEENGARVADEVFAHDLGMTPGEVAYRRRTGQWYGVDWTPAIRAHREATSRRENVG